MTEDWSIVGGFLSCRCGPRIERVPPTPPSPPGAVSSRWWLINTGNWDVSASLSAPLLFIRSQMGSRLTWGSAGGWRLVTACEPSCLPLLLQSTEVDEADGGQERTRWSAICTAGLNYVEPVCCKKKQLITWKMLPLQDFLFASYEFKWLHVWQKFTRFFLNGSVCPSKSRTGYCYTTFFFSSRREALDVNFRPKIHF